MLKDGRPLLFLFGGLDPSGGAGIVADAHTALALGVYPMTICTALTYQTEDHFEGMRWIPEPEIYAQLSCLLNQYAPEVIKFGIIERFSLLRALIEMVNSVAPATKVVVDPVLHASAGFSFHAQLPSGNDLTEVLSIVSVITPNLVEMQRLSGDLSPEIGASALASRVPVFLKGGHGSESLVQDTLFEKDKVYRFEHPRLPGKGKHGSGCVVASALAARLACGDALHEACAFASAYGTAFLKSSSTLLGDHSRTLV